MDKKSRHDTEKRKKGEKERKRAVMNYSLLVPKEGVILPLPISED